MLFEARRRSQTVMSTAGADFDYLQAMGFTL
jgi:hypothetical protein